MPTHRVFIRVALIALFETPVPDNNTLGRTVLTRVLGPDPIDFGKTVFDFKDNMHLSTGTLSKPGVARVVWETKLKPSTSTVLNPIETEGQELLLDFVGGSRFHHLIFLVFFWHVLSLSSSLQRICALWMARSLLRC